MSKLFSSAKNRKWFYGIALAVVAVLSGYGLLSDGQVAVWSGLLMAVFGIGAPALALNNITPDEEL
jgi:hypothetical protein